MTPAIRTVWYGLDARAIYLEYFPPVLHIYFENPASLRLLQQSLESKGYNAAVFNALTSELINTNELRAILEEAQSPPLAIVLTSKRSVEALRQGIQANTI
jgi:hypothetical protein